MNKKKKIIYAGIVFVLIVIGIHIYLTLNPLLLKSKTLSINVGDKYEYKDNISFVYFGNKDDVKINKEINAEKIQEYDVKYIFKDYSVPCHVSIVDKKAPILKLKDYTTDGKEEVSVDQFVESCEDASEYTLSIETKELKNIGETEIEIKAIDEYGNEVIEKCKLTRVEDTTPPVISGVVEYVEVMQTDYYDYEAVTVEDDMDQNPELTITGNVDFSYPGEYLINYMAVDRSGNVTSIDATIVVIQNVESQMNVVYLTFDDGPSYNTPKVLEILDQYNVKATFFVTGNGQSYNNYILQAYQAGHAIGLHTYTHDYGIVYSSVDGYYQDLNNIGQMVQSIIGFVPDIIRFPGGSSNTVSASYTPGIMSELVQSVQARGYQYYDWNVSSSDAAGIGVPTGTIIESATSGTGNQIMILFHDAYGKETTVEALPAVIEHYKNLGYTFLPINKATSYVCHHGVNN